MQDLQFAVVKPIRLKHDLFILKLSIYTIDKCVPFLLLSISRLEICDIRNIGLALRREPVNMLRLVSTGFVIWFNVDL